MMQDILQPRFFSLLPLMIVTDFSVPIGEDTLLKNAQANLQASAMVLFTESHMSSFFEAEIHLVIPGDW